MNEIDAKLLHFALNLNYRQKNITIENQTNQLINFIINDFVKQYKDYFNSKYVVLEFQEDDLSLIAYNILKAIQAVFPFQLLIYNKNKKLKAYLKNEKKKKKKEKRIGNFALQRLLKKDKIIFISCYNPIYQVAKIEKTFKEFNCPYYKILEKFTPDDLKISFEFYNIPIPDSHFIYNRKSNGFADFCNGQLNDNFDYRVLSRHAQSIEKIYIVKLTEDNEKDSELLNEVVDENYPVFYANETPILESEFQYYLKNKSNICGYWNKNFEIAKNIQKCFNCEVIFIGNFSDKEKEDWTYV